MPLPQIPTTTTDTNPIEALPAPSGEGFVSGMYSSLEHSLGISLETQAIGKMAGGSFVPYADAKAQMEAQGYDASVLPSKGLNSGELNAIMNQQSAIKRNEAITQQSDLGTFGKVTSHLIGGAGDPLFLVGGPILGRLGLTVRGMGLGGRVLAGGAEGSATMAGYDIATRQFGTAPGDHDLSTQQIVRDSLVGGLVGGVLHGAFGQRAVPKAGIDSYLNMIQVGENSAGAAKTMGIAEDAVVSKAGAVGRYQVTPGTAKQYGFNPDMLKDPAYNKQAATAILTDLQKRFGDDPDAIAIGYNAGPGVAKKFLNAGRDRSVLPKETRDYLNRIAAQGGRPEFGQRVEAPVAGPDTGVRDAQDAASTALQAAETDARPNIAPAVGDLYGQHQDWLDSISADAERQFDETSKPEYLKQDDTTVRAANDDRPTIQRKTIPSRPSTQSIEPGSKFTTELAAKPIVDRIAAQTPKADDSADLKTSTDAVVNEAQAHSPEGEEFAAHMDDVEDELHKQGYSDEMVKAVHAAVRCGLSRGFD